MIDNPLLVSGNPGDELFSDTIGSITAERGGVLVVLPSVQVGRRVKFRFACE